LPGLHRSGREIPLEISFGEYVKDGKRYFTGIARDVSERVAQQHALEETATELEATVEALQARTEEAEAANQAKTDFLAVMSHELRTPLAAILGFAELLQLGIPVEIPEKSRSHVKRIDAAARHQLQLIEEILSFSRISTGREELDLDRVDLGELAREAAEFIEPLAERKGLPLEVVGPELPLLAMTDGAKVRQILVNLLSNAVKFTSEGEIRVSVERRPTAAVFQVKDTGIGIASEHLKKIFDPFWQVQQSKSREAEGMGLGLTIARRTAQLLDGDIGVESAPGQGSTFTLRLPLLIEDAER
ncbi:MAG TPA: ATP-binding protein, partial [Longimicrobiaceae bacterium]|nr:ATP-binding protein [Longimicrobiaceae bacterium]